MSGRRVVDVLGLAPAMSHPDFRHGRYRPVIQFIMDWNDAPELRDQMLCGGAALTGDVPADLALIAAVVHGLCDRDGIPIPKWVWDHNLATPVTISGQPASSEWGQWVVSQAPAVCSEHGVYFEADLLSTV